MLFVVMSSFTMTANGLQICDGRAFQHNVDAENQTSFNQKTVFGAHHPAYCKCAVMRSFYSRYEAMSFQVCSHSIEAESC